MWKKIIDTNQEINSQKQTLLNAKTADQLLTGKSFFKNAKYAFGAVRTTPYIDNMSLKANYIENREAYHQKMNHALLNGSLSINFLFAMTLSRFTYLILANLKSTSHRKDLYRFLQ